MPFDCHLNQLKRFIIIALGGDIFGDELALEDLNPIQFLWMRIVGLTEFPCSFGFLSCAEASNPSFLAIRLSHQLVQLEGSGHRFTVLRKLEMERAFFR